MPAAAATAAVMPAAAAAAASRRNRLAGAASAGSGFDSDAGEVLDIPPRRRRRRRASSERTNLREVFPEARHRGRRRGVRRARERAHVSLEIRRGDVYVVGVVAGRVRIRLFRRVVAGVTSGGRHLGTVPRVSPRALRGSASERRVARGGGAGGEPAEATRRVDSRVNRIIFPGDGDGSVVPGGFDFVPGGFGFVPGGFDFIPGDSIRPRPCLGVLSSRRSRGRPSSRSACFAAATASAGTPLFLLPRGLLREVRFEIHNLGRGKRGEVVRLMESNDDEPFLPPVSARGDLGGVLADPAPWRATIGSPPPLAHTWSPGRMARERLRERTREDVTEARGDGARSARASSRGRRLRGRDARRGDARTENPRRAGGEGGGAGGRFARVTGRGRTGGFPRRSCVRRARSRTGRRRGRCANAAPVGWSAGGRP